MKPYLLLTPGPLTTSETVKETMMTDWCTWDEDYNLHIVEEMRKQLVVVLPLAIRRSTLPYFCKVAALIVWKQLSVLPSERTINF